MEALDKRSMDRINEAKSLTESDMYVCLLVYRLFILSLNIHLPFPSHKHTHTHIQHAMLSDTHMCTRFIQYTHTHTHTHAHPYTQLPQTCTSSESPAGTYRKQAPSCPSFDSSSCNKWSCCMGFDGANCGCAVTPCSCDLSRVYTDWMYGQIFSP